MHILLITLDYPPELRSNALMMKELADELVLRGHHVTVITAWPSSNLTEQDRQKSFRTIVDENGVTVIRVKTLPLKNVMLVLRGISELLLPYLFGRAIRKHVKSSVDTVVVYTPPLPLGLVGKSAKKRLKAKYMLNIQDIFPQNAIDLGKMKNPLIIRFFERMERRIYQSADVMTSHTITSRRFLIEAKNIPPDKIHYAPNWLDTSVYSKATRTGSFRKGYGLEGRFVILFAGVLGPAQGVDLVIGALPLIEKACPEICFLIVGDGMEKERLQKMAEESLVSNVLFKPFISQDNYPALVKDCDAGLVCLSHKNKTPVVPGKIMGFMAAEIPIVAFLNKESDGHTIIREAECGYSACSDVTPEEVQQLVLKLYNSRKSSEGFGQNGLSYVSKHFAKTACLTKLISLITSV